MRKKLSIMVGAAANFKKSFLRYCNFSDLNLKKAVFKECKINECNFIDTCLVEADFSDTDLQDTVFHNCDLSKANFSGATNYVINPQVNKVKNAKFSFPEVTGLLKGLEIKIV